MKELSFLDKIKILFDNILAHPLFTLLIFVPVIIYFLQKRHGKKVYVILYFLIIFSILFAFGDVIFKLFDNLMDGLFMVLYFPNFITLFGIVILTSIFTLISIFSRNMYKVNKVINFVSFIIIQALFVLILLTIRSNKINVYKTNALYTNSDVLSLMQLLVGMFAIQMISILIISLVNRITEMLDRKNNSFSKNTSKQIDDLSKSKLINPIKVDSDKIGFINVADTKNTSKPKLKPFKFDIEKLESIELSDDRSRAYNVVTLKDNIFSYLNEIVKVRKFKPVKLDSDKIQNIKLSNVANDKKLFNKIALKDKDFTYLNEIIKPRNFKYIKLDSDKIKSIQLNGSKRLFNKISLTDKNITYLNEISKPKKYRISNLDLNKVENISLVKDKKSFNRIFLDNKEFKYLDDIVNSKKYKIANLDLNETQSIKLDSKNKKSFSKKILDNKYFAYLNEIIKPKKYRISNLDLNKAENISFNENKKFIKDNIYENDFDRIMDLKPDLLKPMDNVSYKNVIFNPDILKRNKIVNNIDIIDIQSTLDTVSKHHLIKSKLKGFDDVLTIDKLEIPNFNLLMEVLKLCKLYK